MKLAHLGTLGYALINVYLWWPPKVAAVIVNRTIDDHLGDSVTGLRPTYLSTHNAWDNQNGTCSGNNCFISPNVTQAFRKTYTAGTYYPGMGSMRITMQFKGRHYKVCSLYILIDAQQGLRFMCFSSLQTSRKTASQRSPAPTSQLMTRRQYSSHMHPLYHPLYSSIMLWFSPKLTSRTLSIR